MDIKALILFSPFMTRALRWTGAATRLCEVLKRGESYGVEYVVAFDKKCFYPAVKRYPVVLNALKNHRIYLIDLSPKRFITRYKVILQSAFALSKIARDEKVDLLISPSEADWMCLEAYFAAKISGKPWTAIWQHDEELLRPTSGISSLTPLNVFAHIDSKPSARKNSLKDKLSQAISLLTQLKLAEKTLTLAVSQSLIDRIVSLNPRANFCVIMPGCGVDLRKYQNTSIYPAKYQAIFFSRLEPQKGLHDLPVIWKRVVQKFPKAKLAIAGMTMNPEFIKMFHKQVRDNHLSENIVFFGELNQVELIKALKLSWLALYPSLFDSFPLTVIESLACGVPVVSFDIPAIRSNYGRCRAVLRCSVKDIACMASKVQYILENEKERASLSREAKEYASHYDWERVVKAEKEAYIDVINSFAKKRYVSFLQKV